MRTTIFAAPSAHSKFSASARAAVCASGPSPPPDAISPSKFFFITDCSAVNPKFFVTKLVSWGG
jgi:hypothetical protein